MKPKLALMLIALLILPPAVQAAEAQDALRFNNAAVLEINHKQWKPAIEKLNAALKLVPDYKIAKTNLMIAHNNLALEYYVAGRNNEAVDEFHKSLAIEDDPTTSANLDGALKRLGKDPGSFDERVSLGDAAMKNNDHSGALVEYRYALKLKEDETVRNKFDEMKRLSNARQ